MQTYLKTALLAGPLTVKELAAMIGKSESRTRELLKADQDTIKCKKNDAGTNVFWLDPEPAAEGEAMQDEGDALLRCPLCQSTENQAPAGPEGSFLGSVRTCSDCGGSYNIHTNEEVEVPAKTEKGKRKPLNPQYKINLKTEAVQKAGGKLAYDREAREWVLTKKGKDPKRMTAKEFSLETEETLVKAIS